MRSFRKVEVDVVLLVYFLFKSIVTEIQEENAARIDASRGREQDLPALQECGKIGTWQIGFHGSCCACVDKAARLTAIW